MNVMEPVYNMVKHGIHSDKTLGITLFIGNFQNVCGNLTFKHFSLHISRVHFFHLSCSFLISNSNCSEGQMRAYKVG